MEIKYRMDLNLLLKYYNLPRKVAEVGVAEGLFSRDMMTWGLELLYCVDYWNHQPNVTGDANSSQEWHDLNFLQAKRLLQPWVQEGQVQFFQGASVKMAMCIPPGSLGLVYLDADHSLEGVTNDLEAWYSTLAPGGIIAGHDYLNPSYGVKEAVTKFCRGRFTIHEIPEHKKEDAGFWFQID